MAHHRLVVVAVDASVAVYEEKVAGRAEKEGVVDPGGKEGVAHPDGKESVAHPDGKEGVLVLVDFVQEGMVETVREEDMA